MNQLSHAFGAQFSELIKDGRVQVPGHVKEAIENGLDQARANWSSVSSTVKELTDSHYSTAKSVGDHIIQSATENIDATSEAVLSLTKARTFAEAQKIQLDFATKQLARNMKQSKELIDLATKAYSDAASALTSNFPKITR